MQDFAAIDFEGYGMNIRCINFTACLPHHVNALTPPKSSVSSVGSYLRLQHGESPQGSR